jgi:hypothetical protein
MIFLVLQRNCEIVGLTYKAWPVYFVLLDSEFKIILLDAITNVVQMIVNKHKDSLNEVQPFHDTLS